MKSKGQAGCGEKDIANVGQKDIGAIEISCFPQFAAKAAQPGGAGAGQVSEMIDGQGHHQHEQLAPGLKRMHAHIFDSKARFLLKTIGMIDGRSKPPLSVNKFGISRGSDRGCW